MVKTVEISNKNYNLKASVHTIFKYADMTGRDFLKDVTSISKKIELISAMSEEQRNEAWMTSLMPMLDTILHLAYCMIIESEPRFMGFDEWTMELDDLFSDTGWISDVLIVGMSPFQGKLQSHNPKQ